MAESAVTKRAIADSLKELSKEKPFDKISVGDIAARSNVNRQTFYYHFQDQYDLLTWIYYEDYFLPYMQELTFDNWDECVGRVLTAVREDKVFCVNTIKHAGPEVTRVFMRDTMRILDSAMEYLKDQSAQSGRILRNMNSEEKQFIAKFFAYGVCGILVEWVESGMPEAPETIAKRMRLLLESSKQLAYKRVIEENESEQ